MLNCILIQSPNQPSGLLHDYLQSSGSVQLGRELNSLSDAETYCRSKKADIVFCDLELQLKEIEYIKSLNPGSLMVYVGSRRKAEESVVDELAFAFLYKPFSHERVLAIIHEAKNYLGYKKDRNERNYIFLKSEYKIVRVSLDDILFCEGMKDYSQIFLKDKSKPLVTLQNLKSLMERLDERKFVRVHRSFIVSIEKIDTIARNGIHIGNHEIPIGDSYREKLIENIENDH